VPPTTSNQAVSPRSACWVRWSVGLSAPGEVGRREVRDRAAAGLERNDRVIDLHDGPPAELSPQTPPQGLGVEHPRRHAGHEELPVRVAAQRPLPP
jgi:hypothetical protein